MKKFAALMAIVVAVMFSATLVIGADAPAGKVTIQNKKGPITYDHKAHVDRAKGDCKSCHHEPGKEQKCATCHGEKADGKKLELKMAGHNTCQPCHKKDASKKAPIKCAGCHAEKK